MPYIFIKSPAAAAVITFPYISGTPVTTNTPSSTSHSITLASATVGDLIVVLGRDGNNRTFSVNTGASGVNWTFATQTQNGNAMSYFAWKIAQGSDVLTLTSGSGTTTNNVSFIIKDAVSAGSASSSAGATTTWDSPNLDMGAVRKHLWLNVNHNSVADNGNSPTNYTKFATYPSNIHIWQRNNEVQAENPPSFSNTNSGGGQARWTIGFAPP